MTGFNDPLHESQHYELFLLDIATALFASELYETLTVTVFNDTLNSE